MITRTVDPQFTQNARRLRIDTLSRLRWLALTGQLLTVAVVGLALHFPLPLGLCLIVIGISAGLNIAIGVKTPKSLRLGDAQATALLAFDVLQLAALLFLCGGLENPFSILVLAPVTIAAVSLPPRQILMISGLMAAAVSFIGLYHLPLPWYPGESIRLPSIYRFGVWSALMVACAFICAYAARVADEARTLGQALSAAELALARQTHLSQLDGLAAAAAHELGTPLATITLIAKELSKSDFPDDAREDLVLLLQETQRCRTILSRLSSLSEDDRKPFGSTTLTALIEQVVEPHRSPTVSIAVDASGTGAEPIVADRTAIQYALGNFIENAVDFAKRATKVVARWSESEVVISVLDDGPGFSLEIAGKIGEPYVSNGSGRRTKSGDGGLGLGLFIARTLLERTGAETTFANRASGGASVTLRWGRRRFEDLAG